MNLENLKRFGIPDIYINKFKEQNIKELYPPQVQAIEKGLFENKNLVVSCPTASGKTLIATLAIIHRLIKSRGKIVYIVPLVALANEKYIYYKDLLGEQKKVAISVGNLDSSDPWMKDHDFIVVTSEKLDSLIRHNVSWILDVCLIIVDEIHLLNDTSRGPTLEILLTYLRKTLPNAQVLALSATISNADELKNWLEAKLVLSDFRPVRLYEGICCDSRITFKEKNGYYLEEKEAELGITKDTVSFNKQVLFFVSTRRSSESLAQRISDFIKNCNTHDQKVLDKLSQGILNVLDIPTRQCQRLAFCIKGGVAFHHAGLLSEQKRMIEDNFRKGLIKVIVATPTLAMGVNLPAFRVVVRDIKRYYSGLGSRPIPVLEYKQLIGRAGRPQYDDFGESILVAKSQDEASELVNHYIEGKLENIESKLASEYALRMHTLSLIASGLCQSEKAILDFFSQTFFGFQYKDVFLLKGKLLKVLNNLEDWDFIYKEKEKLKSTRIGVRVSQLYIDPLSAHFFIQSLDAALKNDFRIFSFLQIISYIDEMKPLLPLRQDDMPILDDIMVKNEDVLLLTIPSYLDDNYQDFLKSVKFAALLEAYCDESNEDEILDRFKLAPGELYNKLKIADWLAYALIELTRLLGHNRLILPLKQLRVRLHYGVKEELLDLVRLKDIGRVRARKLYRTGVKGIRDLKKTSYSKLAKILGPKIASKVLKQIKVKATQKI